MSPAFSAAPGSAQLRRELLAAAAEAAAQGRGPYSTLKVGAAVLSGAGHL
jgi:cytidine deaminase